MTFKRIGFILLSALMAESCQQQQEHSGSEVNKQTPVTASPKVRDSLKPPLSFLLALQPAPQVIPVPLTNAPPVHKKTKEGSRSVTPIPPQQRAALLPRASFTFFGTEDGLPQTGISNVFKDSKGRLWFSTQGAGVSCYNGRSFTNFNNTHGLAGNTIWCMEEDLSGNMWFGTDGGGLSRYDGRCFTTFNTTHGLANNTVWCLLKDRNGLLWCGTKGGGMTCYDGREFKNYTTAHGLSSNYIRHIAQDKNGKLWIGTNDSGVCSFDGQHFISYQTEQGLAHNCVGYVFIDHEGLIWFGTEGGGVSLFDGKSFTNFNVTDGLAGNTVWRITQGTDGLIWFGCKAGGISYYEKNKSATGKEQLINLSSSLSLESKNVSGVIQDNSGKMWIGTNGNGIIRYDGPALNSYTHELGISNTIIWCINQDYTGNLWLGTNGGGVCRFDGKNYTTFTTRQGLADDIVWSITGDKKGRIWFGTMNGGASCYDGKSFTNYTTQQGLAGNNIRCITEDSRGRLWFGTFSSGVSCFDGNSFVNYTTEQGLAGNTIRSITEDKEGKIWFASNDGGVSCFDGRSFYGFTREQGLAGNIVFCITQDRSGMLWFGTEGGGVSRYDGKSFFNLTTKEGLADNVVYDIQEDGSGRLWFGTNLGFSVLSFEEIKTMGGNQIKTGAGLIPVSNNQLKNYRATWEIFNEKTGYAIKDLNTNAMYITRKSLPFGDQSKKEIIWGGCGDEKLIRFDPSAVYYHPEPLKPEILGIKIKEEDISWYSLKKEYIPADSLTLAQQEFTACGEILSPSKRDSLRKKFRTIHFDSLSRFQPVPYNLVLPYRYNHVTLKFNAVETGRPYMVNYQYKLDGQDDEWSPLTKNNEVVYNYLMEGTYTFLVKAQSPDGVWSDALPYRFTVLPPWYRTWWAGLSYILFVSFLLYGLYLWRTQRLRKNNEWLEQKVRQRTAEVVEQKELAEQQRRRAEQSEHFKELFLANMSHEIRTPIHAVTGMTSILLDKNPRPDQLRYMECIRNASDSLLVIINDILDLSKIEAGKIELENIEFSVREVIRNVEEIMHFKAEEKGLSFRTLLDEKIPGVLRGDPYRLQQILTNITANAVKFTGKGSVTIRVKTGCLQKENSGNHSSTNTPEHQSIMLTFSVEDTGIGMNKDELGRLFQQYAQAGADTSRKYGGTGLGLSISRQLVEMQGGFIRVDSIPGQGSIFSFDLSFPLSEQITLVEKEKMISPEMLNALKGLKVLLADDNEFNRIVARDTLEMKIENVSVDEACNGVMTLDALRNKSYDILLMDVQMPEMNGFETARKIRQEFDSSNNKIRILALTASVLRNDMARYLQAGMNGYIHKPFKAYDLIGAIYHALHDTTVRHQHLMSVPGSNNGTSVKFADSNYLEEISEGDPVRLQRYIERFLTTAPEFLNNLSKACEQQDFETIRITAHSMKPLLQFTGILKGLELAETIEQYNFKDEDPALLSDLIEQLSSICKDAIRHLNSV